MKVCLEALAVGVSFGVVCVLFGLPIPAPPVLPGVLGVVGVYCGYVVAGRLFT